MRPSDFQVPSTEEPKNVVRQGLTHDEAMELQRQAFRKHLHDQAERRVREWKRLNPKAAFAQDAVARVFEQLVTEHEKTQAEAAAVREASARNAEELASRKAQEKTDRQAEIEDVLGSATKAELVEVVRAYRSFIESLLHLKKIRQADVPADLQ